jgi:uncharacterized phage-associated protein
MVMVSAHDVAAYILKQQGSMTVMKLQKLVYYAQAWSLVWDEELLFEERIEAWANGPVVRELYDLHKGQFQVETWPQGNADLLDTNQQATVNSVLKFYGDKSAQWLSDLTHAERPWKDARKGIPDGERGFSEITIAALAEYYSSL